MTSVAQLALFYLLVYFLISGLDDLGVDLRALRLSRKRRRGKATPGTLPSVAQLQEIPEAGIAVMVPLWQESRVIEAMVETNLRRVDYANYRFFLGVYPNDEETKAAAWKLANQHPRVHVVECPHPGPTSKADCLNHLYTGLQRFHAAHSMRHKIVMLHDAEDLMHPQSLQLANWYSDAYGMVQLPVLSVKVGWNSWVHGVYCDEFAEFLSRDLPVRAASGAFLPSNGVGTAIRIDALESLRDRQGGVLFDPECLTEDYELGLRLHLNKCRQLLLPLTREYGQLLATMEYFPGTLRGAVRQRTRWVIGQCLQSWQKNGWPLQWGMSYWFWRDRRGLIGNFLNAAALLLLALSIVAWITPEASAISPWFWLASTLPGAWWLYGVCTFLALQRIVVRMGIVSGVYGWRFALGVPLRMLVSCCINLVATTEALRRFGAATLKRKRLRWLKTEHMFPDAVTIREETAEVAAVGAAVAAESLAALPGRTKGSVATPDFVQQRSAMPEETDRGLGRPQVPFG